MNGKVIKLNDYKFNFGQETIFLNVFAVFKNIKNGNKYIIYSYDNKKLYCGSAFVKNNEIIVMISKGENDDDIKKVADTYHAYRGTNDQEYKDIAGFCKIAKLDEIAKNDYVLTPGRYVGLAKQEDDGEPYEVKMKRLTSELKEQFEESNKLQAQIKDVLKELGYEI